MAALASPPTPLGTNQSYIAPQDSHFKILNLGAFWTRGDYIVNNEAGTRVFKVDHKFWSSKREITDVDGSVVFRMRMNTWNPRTVYYLEQPDGTSIAQLRGRWNDWSKVQADLHFTDANGSEQILNLRSQEKWYERFEIFYQEQPVARVDRHDYNSKVKKEQGACQTYDLSVAAKVDSALICFIVMALDDSISIYRGASLANPGTAAVVGITAAVRGKKNQNE